MEGLIAQIHARGPEPDLIGELGLLAGISDSLVMRICSDFGGEPLAILCKAAGADRDVLVQLCEGLGGFDESTGLHRAKSVYDGLPVEKAQTVLRYWDWAKAGEDRRK